MKKMYLLLCINLLIFLSFKCESQKDFEKYIEIRNNLSFDILCVPSNDFKNDSMLFDKDLLEANENAYTVKANSVSIIGYAPYCNAKAWEKIVQSDTLLLYILNKKLVLQNKEFAHDSFIVDKIWITYNELVKLDCKINIK